MKIIINKKYKNEFSKEQISEFFIDTSEWKEIVSYKNRKVWICGFLNYKIFLKKFLYGNHFVKSYKQLGKKSFTNSLILLKHGINTPDVLFYCRDKCSEYVATRSVEAEDLWRFLEKNNSRNFQERVRENLIDLLNNLYGIKFYHSDFNITNLLVDNDFNIYVVDLEDVKFNLNERRRKKMINKLNGYLSALSEIELN